MENWRRARPGPPYEKNVVRTIMGPRYDSLRKNASYQMKTTLRATINNKVAVVHCKIYKEESSLRFKGLINFLKSLV